MSFRDALLGVPRLERDAWVDRTLGIDGVPEDEALPAGCVPYLPCETGAIVRAMDLAEVTASDVIVDVGCGIGRAAVVMHLLTDAQVIGVEIQPKLVAAARTLATRFDRVSFIEGDAAELITSISMGTVFFLYCPFSGARLARLVDGLETIDHTIRICSVGLELPERAWLTKVGAMDDIAVHRGRKLDRSITK